MNEVRIIESGIAELLARDVAPLVDRCLDAGVEMARRIVPVDTGELQGGIETKQRAHLDGTDVVGTYGVDDVEHALPVEFGTSTMAAQPYLRPSVDAALQAAR